MRRLMLGMAAVVAGGMATTTAASAAPWSIGPFNALSGPPIERVADGCGPGFHANPWGHCRPNDRGYGYGPPRGYYGPPRGYGYGYDRGYDRPPPRRFYGGY